MKFKLICAISLLFCSLEAAIQDHFKKAENKSHVHSMRNIDFIYMINLDQRPEKFEKSLARLQPYGIHPYRFSAVNGWELSLETINEVGLTFQHGMRGGIMGTSYPLNSDFGEQHGPISNYGQTYFCHCMSRGAIGIVLSHLSILQDALNSGYQTIWVMEDDVEVVRDPHVMSDLINELNNLVGTGNWDILFTDQDTRNNNGHYVPCTAAAQRPNFHPSNQYRFRERRYMGQHFLKIGARYGAYSMIVSRRGMEKILNFILAHKIFLPYDMDFYLPEGMAMYTVREDVVRSELHAPSDNGGANYLNK